MEHIELRLIALYRDGGTKVYEDRQGNFYYAYHGFSYPEYKDKFLNCYPKSGKLGKVKILDNIIFHKVCEYDEEWPPQITNNVQSGSNSSESQHPWPEDHNLSHYLSTHDPC